ncbi:MAG: bifunctional DNA primase/polymerase [Nitrososphaerota archaeon]
MENASDFLNFYLSRGLTILPVLKNEKGPPIYDSWPSLTREEILRRNASVDWQNYNLALRLDDLVVVDVEKPELYDVIFKQPIEVFARVTWIQRTGKGYHILFRGHAKPFKVEGFIEIRSGPQQYILVAPSIHPSGKRYEWVSDISKTPIIEISDHDLERLRRKLEVLKRFSKFIEAMTEYWKKFHRHNLSLWLSGVLRKIGLSVEDAELILKTIALLSCDEELKDRLTALKTTYEKPIEKIGAWSYLKAELESIVGPEHAAEILKLMPKIDEEIKRESLERKPRIRFILGGEIINGRLFEVVENDGELKILAYDPSGNTFEIHEALRIDDLEFRPYTELPFREYLPGVPEAINEDTSLWRDTLEFIREYYDNPRTDDVYHVMVSAVAWSYFCDIVKGSTPYLCFLGPFRSGKTRALEVMASLCYKPMLVVDPSEASMFRIIEEFKPTLFIDEAQIVDKNVRAVMAAGYRFGVKVPRVVDPEADGLEAIRWYDVFGLKIYACREEPPSDIFSRSIIIHCEKNVRHTKKKIDAGKAKELRTRWLAQRLRMFNKITMTFEEFQSEDGRLQELFSPLVVMAQHFGDLEALASIERYGRQIEKEIAAMETTSEDAEIISAILEYVNSKNDDAPSVIPVQDLVNILNQDLPKPEYEARFVGKRLTALGFERTRLHGGKRAYKIDYELLERLVRRYNINVSLKVDSPLVT